MAESQNKEVAESEQHRPDSPSSSIPPKTKSQDEIEYPPFAKVLVILLGVFICGFLIALDRTIVGTATPKITDEFNSLSDVGWYASAYLLCLCGCQLLFGRIFTFFDVKVMYLFSIFIFEVGSAICGAAPNSPIFIVGRAIAGVGAAGLFSGAIPIFMYVLPLHKRPMWTAVFGLVFGVASIIAPLIGGAFTDGVSWRWCFYINLPFGAFAFAIIVFTLRIPPRKKVEGTTWKRQLNQLDPIGTVVFFPCITCLLLALQWGGVTYAWSNARIVALLVLFGVLLAAFICIQFWRQEMATVPPRLLNNRSMIGCLFFQFCLGAAQFTMIYFLPIWFQAIKGVSALESGIMNIPMMLAVIVGVTTGGALTTKIGYYVPFLYLSSVLTPIGAGLISTFTVSTGHSKWIGYQVIFGLGLGFGIQQPAVTAQRVLANKDVPTGVALTFFVQSLAGAMFTSIASNIFDNKFSKGLTSIPGVDVSTVAHVGATDLRHNVNADVLPAVLKAYNAAVVQAFYVAVAISALFVVGAAPVQWKNIKKGKNSQPKDTVEAASMPEPLPEKAEV